MGVRISHVCYLLRRKYGCSKSVREDRKEETKTLGKSVLYVLRIRKEYTMALQKLSLRSFEDREKEIMTLRKVSLKSLVGREVYLKPFRP
jgi:hypothetical protein